MWHQQSGALPFDALALIHDFVVSTPVPIRYERMKSWQQEARVM